MTNFLTVAQVIELRDSEKACPLLEYDLLTSAVGQCQATWDGQYLYPTLLGQSAALIYCVSNAHAFEDANKRTGWLAGVTFLDINGVQLVDISQDEVELFMVGVVTDSSTIEDVLIWLIERV